MDDRFRSRHAGPNESPGFLLWQVTTLWQRRMRDALRDLDLTHPQFVLLASLGYLTRERDAVTQTELAHHARTDVMVTSSVVRTLEGRGLLSRETSPRDSRAKLLRLLPPGQRLMQAALERVEEADARFFAALGTDTRDLNALLVRLRQAQGEAP